MRLDLCYCGLINKMNLSTRVVLLMHAQEWPKPSNTGRIALLALENSEIRLRGLRNGPPLGFEGLLDSEFETWALYYNENSIPVEEAVLHKKKPVRLLVPDGTWSQASSLGAKLTKKLPVKSIKLVGSAPSQYRLRKEHDPNGMATIEAIARVLGKLEGKNVQDELERIFKIMTDRILFARGKLDLEKAR